MKTDKYNAFSKVFAQLSDEAQDILVKIVNRLQKTHQFAKRETAKRAKTLQGAKNA